MSDTIEKPRKYSKQQIKLAEDIRLAAEVDHAITAINKVATCYSYDDIDRISELTGLPKDSKVVYLLVRFGTIKE